MSSVGDSIRRERLTQPNLRLLRERTQIRSAQRAIDNACSALAAGAASGEDVAVGIAIMFVRSALQDDATLRQYLV